VKRVGTWFCQCFRSRALLAADALMDEQQWNIIRLNDNGIIIRL
jgi:hypothetical protein